MVGFLFGSGTGLSYQDLQDRRATADALAKRIMGQQPKNTYEGIGALLTGAAAGIGRYQANKGLREGRDNAPKLQEMISLITGQPAPAPTSGDIPMPGAAAEMAATSPAADVSKNGSTFSPFIETVQAGGLTNPYGLAAVASTGRAESGWSPANAARTWSDPSQSGQAGTAGGVMSWRADRLQNLQGYAASKGEQGNGTPQTQAEFFLREDPQLVAQLNAAKSPEEAQRLMNNAWKFAGYDRAGGEAGRRMGYANGYVSQFQNGQGGQQVASLDPSAGMGGAAAIEQMAPGSGYVDPTVARPMMTGGTGATNVSSAQPPVFDNGRFADPIRLSEMPASRADLPGGLQSQASAYAAQPQQPTDALPTLPTANVAAATQVASAPQQAAPQQVAQAQPQYRAPQPYQVPAQVYEYLANPFIDEGQKDAVRMAVQQQMQASQQQQEEATWRARQDYEQQVRQNDPLYRAQVEKADRPGYRMLTAEERTSYGIPADDTRPYQVGPEGQVGAIGGMGQTQTPGVEARQRRELAVQNGIDPNSAEGQRYILTGTLPTSDRGVTAGDREAIRDADDLINTGEATLGLIDRAIDLSGKAYEGAGAGARALVASQWGDEGALATREFDNIITEQALGQLKSIFGGAPTEGERAILLDVQGSSSQPKPVRDAILQRARKAVERRVNYNRDRANELRGGTYYKPRTSEPNVQTNPPQTPAEATGMPPSSTDRGPRVPIAIDGYTIKQVN